MLFATSRFRCLILGIRRPLRLDLTTRTDSQRPPIDILGNARFRRPSPTLDFLGVFIWPCALSLSTDIPLEFAVTFWALPELVVGIPHWTFSSLGSLPFTLFTFFTLLNLYMHEE